MYTFVVQFIAITQIYCQNVSLDSLNKFNANNTILQNSTPISSNDSILVASAANDTILDSTKAVTNTNPFDTVDISVKEDDLKAPVTYIAEDSIVYDIDAKMLYLYGDAKMDYQATKINAERVSFDWTTQILSAEGIDSSGKQVGTPVMDQEGQIIEANKMDYSFKTQKGKIYDVVTEDNGAFIHSEIVKKTEENHWLSYKTKYTTCTDKEHPHFYIAARKAKIIPDKVMVSGAADLVISGINTPLAVPFAIFPLQKGRRSGIVLPKPTGSGDFFAIQDGGYFWAVNNNFNLKFLGEVVTNGTFGVKVSSNYAKKYKYSGNVLVSFRRVIPDDPILNKGLIQNDFNLVWSHRMDNKADPNNNFNASLDIQSNSYDRNQIIQTQEVLQVINSSNLAYVRRFNGKPYTLTINARFDQNLKTHAFNVTLPEVAFTVNKILPFKSKISSSKKKFYEKIGFTYKARAKALVNTTDTAIFTQETLESLRYGINQDVAIDATYSMFKYLNITPRFDYAEQWFFKEETIDFGPVYTTVNDTTIDTTYTSSSFDNGFYARRNFNASLALSTKVTGIYTFKKGNLKAIKHLFTPSVTYNYRPNFSDPIWNYYNSYYDENIGKVVDYNQYTKGGVYESPGNRELNSLTIALDNRFDMKVHNKKDTANLLKKMPLLKALNFRTTYNFAGDSVSKFNDLVFFANTSILNGLFALQASLVYNPYSRNKNNTRIAKSYWQTDQKILRFESLNLTVDFNLNGKPKPKNAIFENEYGSIGEQEFIARNPQLFYDFDIPWNFNARYHFSMKNGTAGDKDKTFFDFTNFSFGGDVNITPKWKIAVQSGYDFKRKDFTLTNVRLLRDLHCWEMSLNWQAYPIQNSSFQFEIRVKSAILQDLKLSRRNPQYSNINSF